MIDIIYSNWLHLVSMLLCIAVVACVFIRYYAKGKDIDDSDKKVQKLHTFYISGILVFIIIELVTGLCMRQGNSSEILSYVSFAATLSSLIMSIVAIIFTIVFSSRGDEQYKKIDRASDRVSESLSEFSKRTYDIDNSVSLFKEASDSLTKKMEAILSELRDVRSITEEIKDTTSNYKVDSDSESGGFSWDTDGKKSKKVLDTFISSGSFSGNCALYACVLSKEKEKHFSLTDITDGTPNDISYRYGYLVAASALGIIDGDIDREDCIIKYYYHPIKQLLEDDIERYINSSKNYIDKRRAQFNSIKTLFGVE